MTCVPCERTAADAHHGIEAHGNTRHTRALTCVPCVSNRFYMELAVESKPRQCATDVGFKFFPCDMELGHTQPTTTNTVNRLLPSGDAGTYLCEGAHDIFGRWFAKKLTARKLHHILDKA